MNDLSKEIGKIIVQHVEDHIKEMNPQKQAVLLIMAINDIEAIVEKSKTGHTNHPTNKR